MELTRKNLEVFAAKFYRNESCMSREEFLEDLELKNAVKRMTKRFAKERSSNIRLFCNHVIAFTNNFDVEAAKKILKMDLDEQEASVLNTVFNYLGYTTPGEVREFHLFTAKALKEMDR